jgi:Protein of unknown function (DUF4238)
VIPSGPTLQQVASDHKRNHQVPQFYLQRFASDGKVAVRWRDGKTYETSPLNVAVESGFYDIPDDMGGVSKEVETGLADIEGMADKVLRRMDRSGRLPGPRDEDSATLALFIGLQVARTTSHRERVMFPRRVVDWADGREVTRELVAEFLEMHYLGFAPGPPEVDGAYTMVSVALRDEPRTLTDEFGVEMMLSAGIEISTRVLALNWSIERDRREEFITSDAPVVLWRKPTPRDDYEGLGIDNSEQVRFPLDPGKQLVLSRRERPPVVDVAVHRVRRSNEDMADACHRFIVGSPTNRVQTDAQRLLRWRPLLRFNVAPLLKTGPRGQSVPAGGDVVHTWAPRGASAGLPRGPRRR